jgi:excinuclease ABC subunit C
MVAQIADIEWLVVDSELEALVLECNLIKQHRPPYNVRMRDDKSYPYIVITKEPFPRVLVTRRVKRDSGKYFGPYSSAFQVRETVQLLHKVFPLIPCGKSWSGQAQQRPCLYFHLGQCLAPCAGKAQESEYAGVIDQVEQVLKGREDSLILEMREKMESASDELDFEVAAKIRDQISALEHTLQRQKVLSVDKADQDVVAVVKDERGAAIHMLYVRGGKLLGQRQFLLDGAGEAAPSEAVQEFVKQYYTTAPDIPREIVLPVEIEERAILQSWLRQRKGSTVTVEVPGGGEKLRLMEMAAENAELALKTLSQEAAEKEKWAEEAMSELQEALELSTPPVRIEGYDISNIQGTAPVGSMVVCENAEPAKHEYRRFKIKFSPESPNDFAMMNEVILRRLRRHLEGDEKFANLPDLFMIDGGKGQLSAALKARDALGLTTPMVGLAKRQEILFVPYRVADGPGTASPEKSTAEMLADRRAVFEYEYREVILPLHSPGLLLLRRLRDEAHRFALSFHRKVRDKRLNQSVLDEVPGIGPRKKRLLLRTFGSIEAIRRATVEQVAAVPTMTESLANRVKQFLEE